MEMRRVEPKRYIGLRIIATIIDYGIYFGLFYLYLYSFGDKTENGYELNGWLCWPIPIFWFLYFVILESYTQTPGHDICKLIVVKTNGENLTIGDAFKRRLLDSIDIFIYGIPALICICNTPKYQRLGDLFADTLVVKRSDLLIKEIVF